MAFPVASILSAVAPLVLGAVEQYRRRNEASVTRLASGGADLSREALPTRLMELEASDLEQIRLISELSRNVEALAKTMAASHEERRRAEARTTRMLWVIGAVAMASLVLSIWNWVR